MDCVWVIQSPSGTKVQLDFDRELFQLERAADGRCTYDFVELRDGASPLAPLLGRYCGTDAPGSTFSSGNYMFVRFASDESAIFRGFQATYKIGE